MTIRKAKTHADKARVVRTVTLPIVDVFTAGGERPRVIDVFRPAWRLSTDLANWCQRELALRDVRRAPGMERYPAYDRKAMFGEVPRKIARKVTEKVLPDGSVRRGGGAAGEPKVGDMYSIWNRDCPPAWRAAWDGSANSAQSILKAVEHTWRTHKSYGRFAVMWKGEARPAVFRWPYPWPIESQNIRLMRGYARKDNEWGNGPGVDADGNDRLVQIPLPMPSEKVWLRLTSRGEFRRQHRTFDTLLADPSRVKQAKVTGRWAGGRLVGADLRLVGSFDAAETVEGVSAMLSTRGDSLLAVCVDGDGGTPWVYHGDHLAGLITAHDRWRHRFAEDLKHEKRWPSHKRQRTTGGCNNKSRCDRANARLRSERQQIAACVVGYLRRRGVGHLDYDDSEKGYLPRWGYHAMREVVSSKCEEFGIAFQHLAGADDDNE